MSPDAIAQFAEIGRDLTVTTLLIVVIIAIVRGELVTKGHHQEVKRLLEDRLERIRNGNARIDD